MPQPADGPFRAELRPVLPGPPVSPGCQGAARRSVRLLCRPRVLLPVSISLSPSLLTPQTARGPRHDASSVKKNLDPGCARRCGRKTTWALYFSFENCIPLLYTVTGLYITRESHVGFVAESAVLGFSDGWYFGSWSVIDKMKLPFDMPFTMQCTSYDYVSLWALRPASLRGDHFHQDLHPPPLAIVGHVDACLI